MLRAGIGTVIFGRYFLRRELARGGMGSVWEATDRKLRRPVAVKLLYPLWAQSADALARFEREAMAVAQLQSPHVVQIFDYGIDRECPFIVMELLDGEDLRTRLKRCGRLSLDDTAHIVAQAAKALSAAHSAGIIHRDLKPGNVFLQRGRDEELVKLLDFGVAKATMTDEDLSQETTKEGAILGTPRYMSPEQARQSRAVDFRTDLWSLAVIAFRALTGNVPYSGKSAADIIVRLCTEPPPAPSSVAPDLGPELDEFFRRALQRQPELRFGTAREMAVALARIAPTTIPSLNLPTPPPDIRAARARAAARAADADDDAATVVAVSGGSAALQDRADAMRADQGSSPPPPGESASGVVAHFVRTDADGAALGGDEATLRQALEADGRNVTRWARPVLVAALAVALGLTAVVVGIGRCSSGLRATHTGDQPQPTGSGGPQSDPTDLESSSSSSGGEHAGGSPPEQRQGPPEEGQSTAGSVAHEAAGPSKAVRSAPSASRPPEVRPSASAAVAPPRAPSAQPKPPPTGSIDPFAERL